MQSPPRSSQRTFTLLVGGSGIQGNAQIWSGEVMRNGRTCKFHTERPGIKPRTFELNESPCDGLVTGSSGVMSRWTAEWSRLRGWNTGSAFSSLGKKGATSTLQRVVRDQPSQKSRCWSWWWTEANSLGGKTDLGNPLNVESSCEIAGLLYCFKRLKPAGDSEPDPPPAGDRTISRWKWKWKWTVS